MENLNPKETTKKKDFVEISYIAKNVINGEVFDTNIKEEADRIKLEINPKPLVVCIGQGMVVIGLDESLEGKEINKKYSIKLSPEKAFGPRNKQLIKLIPLKAFTEHKVYPQAGMSLVLDNSVVRVISVSGGRVMVDFNNPMAGKEVEYEFTITKKVEDLRDKVNALQNFFFGKEFDFDMDEKNKSIVFHDLQLTPILKVFNPKFNEMLGYKVEILAKPESNEKKIEESK